jgi:putative ABC transport system ATP-binding protein
MAKRSERSLWRRLRRSDPHAEWRPDEDRSDEGSGIGFSPTSGIATAPEVRTREEDRRWRPGAEGDPPAAGPEGAVETEEPAVVAPSAGGRAGDEILEAKGLIRTYPGRVGVTAVRGASIRVRPGDFIALMGPSGSGKSTLLGLLAGLDRPDAGEVRWRGTPMDRLDAQTIMHLRRKDLGIVFQSFGLLPTLSALENVELPLRVAGTDLAEAREAARGWLVRLGLEHRLDNRTHELSAGQQQRVAVARALVIQPDLVLADEPIAEVDSENADIILDALAEVSRRGGAVVAATHNPAALAYASTVVLLRDGKVEATDTPEALAGRLSTD